MIRRLLSKPMATVGVVLVGALVVLAVIGPWIWGDRATEIAATEILRGRSAAHPLGTDGLGRDVLARLLVATRLSLLLSLAATGIGVAIGLPLGALPTVLPARLGRAVVTILSSLVAFPGLLLAMFTAVVAGLGARGAVFGIGVAIAPPLARLTYTLTSSVAGSDYVAAARVLRVPRHRILTRHLLPNVAEPLILNITMIMGSALLGMAALSFLGLGVQPPSDDWGRMLAEGLDRVYVHPEVAVGPAVAIVVAGIAFHLLGEAMARAVAHQPARGSSGGRDETVEVDPAPAGPDGSALHLDELTVTFPSGSVPVAGVSLRVDAGQIVGVVGESGSGKSLTAMAIGGLVPFPGRVATSELALAGQSLATVPPAARRRLLGTSLAMVFQDPMSSLNPAMRVGTQLAEVATVHGGLSRTEARRRAVDRLGRVRITRPAKRARQRPYQFSGGMRQRAVIAMGMMGTPRLLIADEPTTALDVTVQREILRLVRDVADDSDAGVVFISHDMAVVSQLCDRVVVMYAGRVVEELPVGALATQAAHPYTRALVACLPDLHTDRDRPLVTIPGRPPPPTERAAGCAFAPRCTVVTDRCRTERPPLVPQPGGRLACWHPQAGPVLPDPPSPVPASAASASAASAADAQHEQRPTPAVVAAGGGAGIELRGVTVRFGRFTAVDDVTLSIAPGQTVGLVGESGSGKSTLAKAVVGLVPVAGGSIGGVEAGGAQMVFQDPYASLDPRMSVGASIAEGFRARRHPGEVDRLLELVSLDPAVARRLPHELSGGQRQRVAVARALAARPQLLIADEITSALDVSVQGAILNLIREMRAELGISVLFVSHNLAVVRYVADVVAVMREGRLVEVGPTEQVLGDPRDDYTRELIAGVPTLTVGRR